MKFKHDINHFILFFFSTVIAIFDFGFKWKNFQKLINVGVGVFSKINKS